MNHARYFALFASEQFHFLTLEQLNADPPSTIAGVLRFLGVDLDFTCEWLVVNEGRITARIPAVQFLWNQLVTRPTRLRNLGLKLLTRVNMKKIPPMNLQTRTSLLQRYRSDIQKLQLLTGLCVDAWEKSLAVH